MRIQSGNLHLTYCTNIHPADGWPAVFDTLRRFGPALKARFAPQAPFGLGLRLSARDARELLAGGNLRELRAFLDDQGLYVAIINGFPYGHFHGSPVKADVYAPDWRDEARVAYTLDLAEILSALLPEGVDGGVSTAPLSYKAWMARADAGAWDAMTHNVARVAGRLARLREERGTLIHLDIEPEPDCSIENTDETIAFFERHLLRGGASALAAAAGGSEEAARARLLEHVRLCFDCCHFAVEFEDAAQALARFAAAGIRIGRAQLSSALDVPLPPGRDAAARAVERLRPFADPTYLHQVVERQGTALQHYPDLPEALAAGPAAGGDRWRVHFHVPLFTAAYDELGSTQQYVAAAIRELVRTRATHHLEIETYTWDVLPPGLKLELLESIAREYEWVMSQLPASSSELPAPSSQLPALDAEC